MTLVLSCRLGERSLLGPVDEFLIEPAGTATGAAQGCALQRDPTSAGTALTHLLLQQHLHSWLCQQGLAPQIEKQLSDGGRADLHVRVAEQGLSEFRCKRPDTPAR